MPSVSGYGNVINICIRSCFLSSELYITTALETQEQETKLLKTTVHMNFLLVGLFGIWHLKLSFGHMLTFIYFAK